MSKRRTGESWQSELNDCNSDEERAKVKNRYRNSAVWKAKRKYAIALSDGVCSRCASDIKLEVHHRNENARSNYCTALASELVVLCKSCHTEAHRRQNNKQCQHLIGEDRRYR